MPQRRTPGPVISRPATMATPGDPANWRIYKATGTTAHFRPIRTRGPLPGLYQHRDDAAAQAWNQVAAIQARLRGEPEPAPVAKPWTLPPCDGCGYRFRCECPAAVTRDELRGSDTQPDPYIDSMAAEHDQEYEPEPQPDDGPPRCEDCGYLVTRCDRPGGPRGGAR